MYLLNNFLTEDGSLVDVYTVEDAIDKMGCGVFQILLALVAGGMWVSSCMLLPFNVLLGIHIACTKFCNVLF